MWKTSAVDCFPEVQKKMIFETSIRKELRLEAGAVAFLVARPERSSSARRGLCRPTGSLSPDGVSDPVEMFEQVYSKSILQIKTQVDIRENVTDGVRDPRPAPTPGTRVRRRRTETRNRRRSRLIINS